jgi:L-fucose isomerase-like protein
VFSKDLSEESSPMKRNSRGVSMRIKIIGLTSDGTKEFIIKEFEEVFRKKIPDFEIVTRGETFDIAIFVVATGGVENQFKSVYTEYKPPYILVYNEFNNSLPASLEILSFLNREGLKGTLVDVNRITKEEILKSSDLAEEKLGLIGKPSDWLIASQYPLELYRERFKINVIYIPIEEAIENFKNVNEAEANLLALELINGAKNVFNIDLKEVTKSFKFYISLRGITEKYNLNYVSVRCFDIIKPLDTTGCIALSKLTDEGFVAGCEGDLPSTISMILLGRVSLKTPFMANVSYVEEKEDSLLVTLAHCTIALSAVDGFNLRTHFETGKGVGIEGFFPRGSVTILRIGGENLDEGFVVDGEEVGTEFSSSRCRTQLKVRISGKYAEYFYKKPLGNHHIVVSGNFKKEVQDLFKSFLVREIA